MKSSQKYNDTPLFSLSEENPPDAPDIAKLGHPGQRQLIVHLIIVYGFVILTLGFVLAVFANR
jgi:hypothetical protein